jgi:hypothetical protein
MMASNPRGRHRGSGAGEADMKIEDMRTRVLEAALRQPFY